MFAILITEETVPKILVDHPMHEKEVATMGYYFTKKYYFISHYYNSRGTMVDWTILPAYIFEKMYEYDAEKIKTDWDQVVHL